MELIRKIYHAALKYLLNFKWNYQMLLLRLQVRERKIEPSIKGRVLILAPHSDDEWIGCSQILNDQSLIVEICNMNMPGGDSKFMHSERLKEMMNVAKVHSREFITLQGDKISELSEILDYFHPDYVCVPFLVDWHKEHREVMCYLDDVINNSMKDFIICMYQVSVPIPEKYINCGITMSRRLWQDKWKNFVSYYPSQLYIPYKRFAINERINGKIGNGFALESYSLMSVKEWREFLNKTKHHEVEISNLVSDISDLIRIRSKVVQVCKSIFQTI